MTRRSHLISTLLALSLLLAIVVVSPASDSSKPSAARVQLQPFEPAEKLVYEGEFTRSLLRGIDVADLSFSFSYAPTAQTGKDDPTKQAAFRFTGEAISKGIVSKLFGLNFRQRVESVVEPTRFSVLQTTKVDEQGKRKRASEAVFDPGSGKIVFTEIDPSDPKRAPRVVNSQVDGRVVDIASAFYYLRTLKLEPGMTVELLISDTGEVYRTPVKIVRRERIKTVFGNINTLRVVPELFGDGHLIRGKGEITIWFTDDARLIPVRAKINNSLGRLDIKLKKVTNGR
jgi:hypothetical protein